MLAQLKRLALDPCRPQFARDNIKPLWNQILRLRKVMVYKDSEIPWRKRKLEQFVNDKLRARSGLVLPNQQTVTKKNRSQSSHASSVSCLLNSVDSTQCHDDKIIFDSHTCSSLTFDEALPDKQAPTECSFLDDIVHWHCPGKDVPPTVDSDESVNGSNLLSPENLSHNEASVEISNAIHRLNSPTLDGLQRRHLQPLRRSIRLLNFIGDHLQRKAIPVGPHFQASVPEWSGPVNRSVLIAAYNSDSDNSKWLGSRVWPIEIGNMKTTGRTIGKGRRNSCCCVSPGFSDCIRRHIFEKRLLLQSDLGPAFFSWKFDEMGEQVSNSWSPKEQQTFESLVKRRPSSNGKNFLKRALKCFPNKYRKDIINYYFNVYVPRRMSLQTRLSPVKQVYTDDEDETQDFNYMGLQKTSGGRSLTICSRKM
ncbi:AT-rich interactive domain-containing protein 1 [Sesamum alatum]|uniref:AT-rich interactive domain-containing protein 1 n=1 Tax=Sesamum alatum TaxID=300844 RepID=A0AAE2CEC1_9LAMI|nr:AT-rich interactive domain-containing protein 1 [Sesamum alatum]